MPRYSYRVSRGQLPGLEGCSSRTIGNYTIEWSRELQSRDIRDAQGELAAIVVGEIFDPRQEAFAQGDIDAPITPGDRDGFERFIDTLSGPFFAVTSEDYGSRLYMDPGASLPIFWRSDTEIAGSSPVEIASAEELEANFDEGLYRTCIEAEGMGSWIGGDLTAYRNIRKLLPNFRLELSRREPVRHWPTAREWKPFAEAVSQASSALLTFMPAAAEHFDLKVALTAGYDTRLVLAATRDVKAPFEYFTLKASGAELDLWAADQLAKLVKRKHRPIDAVRSSPADVAMWDERVGYSVRESNREHYRSLTALGPDAIIATGMYGEVGRCRLYRQNVETINGMEITADFVAARLTIPAPDRVKASIEWWLDTLSGFPPSVIMDLAFLELKFGSWAMGQKPATSQVAFTISPFAQRRVLDAFVFVAPKEKRTTRLFDALIEACWPTVAKYPINKYGDFRDQMALLRKATNPNRVRRFLRDRFARVGR